jgi:hypothetical protein
VILDLDDWQLERFLDELRDEGSHWIAFGDSDD